MLDPHLVSNYWIMKNIFGFTDEEIKYESMDPTISRNMAAEISLAKAIHDHDREAPPFIMMDKEE